MSTPITNFCRIGPIEKADSIFLGKKLDHKEKMMTLTHQERRIALAKEKHLQWQDDWNRVIKNIQPYLRKDTEDEVFIDTSCPAKLRKKFKKLVVQGIERGYLTAEEEPENPAVPVD